RGLPSAAPPGLRTRPCRRHRCRGVLQPIPRPRVRRDLRTIKQQQNPEPNLSRDGGDEQQREQAYREAALSRDTREERQEQRQRDDRARPDNVGKTPDVALCADELPQLLRLERL